MERQRVWVLITFCAVLLFAIGVSACGGGAATVQQGIQELNGDQIGDNFSHYFSLKYGRQDAKLKGTTVTLFPWDEDQFVFKVKLPSFSEEVVQNESREKKSITFESGYSLSEDSIGPTVTREVKVVWKGKEIKVPIKIQLFSAKKTLGKEDVQYLKSLKGKKVAITMRVDLEQKFSVMSASNEEVQYANASALDNLVSFMEKAPQEAKSQWGKRVSEAVDAILVKNKEYQELQNQRKILETKLSTYQKDSKDWKNTKTQVEKLDQRMATLQKEAASKAQREIGPFEEGTFAPEELLSRVIFVLPVVIEEVNGVAVGE